MKKFFLIITFFLLFKGGASANTIAKIGSFDCGAILEFKDIKDSQESVQDWLNGFLTSAQFGRKSFKKDQVPSSSSRYFWVIKFCEENPLSDITDAAAQLYYELIKE